MPWLTVNQTRLSARAAVPTALLALDVQRGGIPRGPAKSVKRSNPVRRLFLKRAFSEPTLKQRHEHRLSRSNHSFIGGCYRLPQGERNCDVDHITMKRQFLLSTHWNWSEGDDLEHMDHQGNRAGNGDPGACLRRRVSVDQVDPAEAVRQHGFDPAMAMHQDRGNSHRLHQEVRLSARVAALPHQPLLLCRLSLLPRK